MNLCVWYLQKARTESGKNYQKSDTTARECGLTNGTNSKNCLSFISVFCIPVNLTLTQLDEWRHLCHSKKNSEQTRPTANGVLKCAKNKHPQSAKKSIRTSLVSLEAAAAEIDADRRIIHCKQPTIHAATVSWDPTRIALAIRSWTKLAESNCTQLLAIRVSSRRKKRTKLFKIAASSGFCHRAYNYVAR